MPEPISAPPMTRSAFRGWGRLRYSDPAPGGPEPRATAGVGFYIWLESHPFVIDLVIALALCALLLIFEFFDGGEVGATLGAFDIVIATFATALILLRRYAPIPVLVVSTVTGVWSLFPADDQVVLRVVTCLALYTVASTTNRPIAWTAGALTAGALFLAALITNPGPWFNAENLQQVTWAFVATAAGDAVRSRRSYLMAKQEYTEQVREEETRRRVIEERLRIARELHDVVAHHIAVINVQAGVATHLLRNDPAGAEEALVHVRGGARSVLDELSSILSVMRRSDDTSASTDPLPTLDQLDQLIAGFSGIGFDIEWHTAGARQPVPPAVALAAYRIVQESLTNAHRHGSGGRAWLRIDYLPGSLAIEVLNQIGAVQNSTSRPGHGISGMRGRIAAAGGTIEIGPGEDGRFRVFATLPLTGGER